MDLFKELKFTQGAVAKKSTVPALTHFRIENGHIRSYNGKLALSCPIPLDITCTPKAAPLVKAIQNCKDTITMSLTKSGRLSIKSGPFKAFIECTTDATPHVTPSGEIYDIDGEHLLEGLRTLTPLVGDNAMHPWSTGILFKDQSVFATNNRIVAQYWVGSTFPLMCNVPKDALKEIIRIGEAPKQIQSDLNSISFLYSDGRWIRSCLLDTKWPDVERVLEGKSNPVAVPEELFDAIIAIKPFTDTQGRVFLRDGVISTTVVPGEGASFDLEKIPHEGVYHLDTLSLLKNLADTIDFSLYPKPCLFFGNRLRGALTGLKI